MCSSQRPENGADSDFDYRHEMYAEGKHECGECGINYPEDEMTPLIDRYGEWWRCAPCGVRDFQAYNEAMTA